MGQAPISQPIIMAKRMGCSGLTLTRAVEDCGFQDLWVPGRQRSHAPVPRSTSLPLRPHTCSTLQVPATHPGPRRLTASQHKESHLPHSWVPRAHPVTAPEEGPRNFSPDRREVGCAEETPRAGCVITG